MRRVLSMKIKIAFLFLISTFIIVFTYCQGSTEPGESFKDPREMTWTVDTLMYPGSWQTSLSSMYGKSSTDIYACGHTDINLGKLWHFDGFSWISIDLFQFIENSYIDLQQVRAVGDDIWVVGAREYGDINNIRFESLVLQYNGRWIEHKVKTNSYLYDITGTTNMDIWACGRNGLVLHYNGYSWTADTIRIKNFSPEADYVLAGIARYNNETFIIARVFYEATARREQYYIRGNMKNWKVIDSTIFTKDNWGDQERWGNLGMFRPNNGKIYSFGFSGVWELDVHNNNWTSLLRNNFVMSTSFGANDNYLFAATSFGFIWFYDGKVWNSLSNIVYGQKEITFYDGWTNGEEVFLLGFNSFRSYIVHGK